MAEEEIIILKEKLASTFMAEQILEANLRADCFVALSLTLLGEFFMSGMTKQLIFASMIENLTKMGYSEDQLEEVKVGLNNLFTAFHKPNSFMG